MNSWLLEVQQANKKERSQEYLFHLHGRRKREVLIDVQNEHNQEHSETEAARDNPERFADRRPRLDQSRNPVHRSSFGEPDHSRIRHFEHLQLNQFERNKL